jgi:glutamate dehydrogenase
MTPEGRTMERSAERGRARTWAPAPARLGALLARRASGAEALRLAVFAQELLARGGGYLDGLGEEELAAAVWSAYRFYAAPGPALRVRVVSPTYVTEGWDAPVSVIETAMSDRPFIVDTVRAELAAAGVEVRTFLHPIFAARRDPTGALEALTVPRGETGWESFLHVGIAPIAEAARRDALAAAVRRQLERVLVVTDDFPAMVARAQAVAAACEERARAGLGQEAAEATAVADLLRWLVDGNFVFLGYREYALEGTALHARPGSGLGLLREGSVFAAPAPLESLPARVQAWLASPQLLSYATTRAESPVHRRVHMDDFAVKAFAPTGRVVGEHRFLGLLTSKAQTSEAAEIPLLRRTLRQILNAERVVRGSHDYKAIVAVFNTMPKSELLASTAVEIRADIRTILAAERSEAVAVRVRRAPGRVSALVVMPAARFSGEAQARVRTLLAARLGGTLLAEHLHVDEEGRARLHFAFTEGTAPLSDRLDALEEEIAAVVRTWEERLRDALLERYGRTEGAELAARWAGAFPRDYQAAASVERACADVAELETARRTGGPRVTFVADADGTSWLRFYTTVSPVPLAELLPQLEHLGLRPLTEDQVAVRPAGEVPGFVQSFQVEDRQGRSVDVAACGPRLGDALLAVRAGRAEDDALGRLVLEAGLDWRAVAALRAYAGWLAQTGLAPRATVVETFAEHPAAARALFDCFAARMRPGGVAGEPRAAFFAALEGVQSLRADTLLRAAFDAVEATVRTTFFAEPAPEAIAIKLRGTPAWLPRPRPLYEIWVHSPTLEGIHLRAGLVARGGIRLSDRRDDLRTEILGLMKTQCVKNAVIVPTGAKGGFVLRGAAAAAPTAAAITEAYRTFIRSLLALTDNVVDGRVVHPRGLVVHDGEDPYLVVAADKGTSTLSDVANALAAEAGFWLGDAFASGGSHGYDHKALGITARGAWESVRAHCRELGLDADHAPLTVIGIGDPSGDVFGNGLLRSPALRLLAAFNHRHVFLDPDPDPVRSFAERERLFHAGSGWEAYDPAVLSRGGQIVDRSAKRVALSPEVRALLGVADEAASGEALVRAVLACEADLLFNGGIGTYVKASGETHAEVGDPANDAVRVDASALRVRMVAEGGNLGFTQRARVEYALAGGRINTDAVDNSAGVDLSDHEVNLKIALAAALAAGRLDSAERDALLAAVTPEVTDRVLAHNRRQARLLGVEQVRSRTRLEEFRALAEELEAAGELDRTLAALPDRAALRARRGVFLGLARPELAVLMAHAKLHLQRLALASPLPDDPLLEPLLFAYFPSVVVERFPDAVRAHRLRREIVATELANAIVDRVGMTFVSRLARDAGAAPAAVMRAWAIAWAVADGERLAQAVEAAGLAVDVDTSCQIALEGMAARAAEWVLANDDAERPAAGVARELSEAAAAVLPQLESWLAGAEAEAFRRRAAALEIAGLPGALAHELALAEWLPSALDVVTVARELGIPAPTAAARYYALGGVLDFAWVFERLGEVADEDHWQRRAVEGLAADVREARRRLARSGPEALPTGGVGVVTGLVRDLRAAPRVSLAALTVVVRELRRLAQRVGG